MSSVVAKAEEKSLRELSSSTIFTSGQSFRTEKAEGEGETRRDGLISLSKVSLMKLSSVSHDVSSSAAQEARMRGVFRFIFVSFVTLFFVTIAKAQRREAYVI